MCPCDDEGTLELSPNTSLHPDSRLHKRLSRNHPLPTPSLSPHPPASSPRSYMQLVDALPGPKVPDMPNTRVVSSHDQSAVSLWGK